MTIPVSTVVDVAIQIGATFPARAGFGTLNIVTSETGIIGSAERTRFYNNIDGVTADWSGTSEVVAAATTYFAQQPKPTKLKVSVRFPAAQGAELRGGSVLDDPINLAVFKSITDGSFNISIDTVPTDITALDFSAITDMASAATVIQVALDAEVGGTTCSYDGSRFYITSPTTGTSSTLSYLFAVDPASGTDMSSLLQMKQGEGTKSDGINAETITSSLNAIQNQDSDWYGLLFTKEVRDGAIINGEDAVVAAAAWCEARVKVFFNTSNDLDVLDSVTTNDIVSILRNNAYRRTINTFSSYPDQYPSASIAGRAFTVNFSQPNSTITLKFKQTPNVTVERLTQTQKATLDSKYGNAVISVGGNFMFAESWTAGKVFLDEVHGLDWLQNAIQINIFGYLFTRSTKVPYTDIGIAALEQQMINALDEGVKNGLLAPGTTIDDRFLPRGYETTTTPAAEVDQSSKESRHYAGLGGTALGAGAIHSVQANIVFER